MEKTVVYPRTILEPKPGKGWSISPQNEPETTCYGPSPDPTAVNLNAGHLPRGRHWDLKAYPASQANITRPDGRSTRRELSEPSAGKRGARAPGFPFIIIHLALSSGSPPPPIPYTHTHTPLHTPSLSHAYLHAHMHPHALTQKQQARIQVPGL